MCLMMFSFDLGNLDKCSTDENISDLIESDPINIRKISLNIQKTIFSIYIISIDFDF